MQLDFELWWCEGRKWFKRVLNYVLGGSVMDKNGMIGLLVLSLLKQIFFAFVSLNSEVKTNSSTHLHDIVELAEQKFWYLFPC